MTGMALDAGQTVHETALQALRERGFSHHERGELVAAERSYRQVLLRAPEDVEILHALGVLLTQSKDFAAALPLISEVLRRHETAGAHSHLGNAYCGLARFEEAIGSYDRALTIAPHEPSTHFNRGNALRALGRRTEALASYEGAIQASPILYEAALARAELLLELGRSAEALAGYDVAIALRGDIPELHLKRAAAAAAQGLWDGALRSIDRAISLGADSAEAFVLRGMSLAGLTRGEEALASYHCALEREPQYWAAHVNRGVLLRACDRLPEALESYDAALLARPDGIEALCNRAAVLMDLARYEEALADCDRALALKPDWPEAHAHRAQALLAQAHLPEALLSYESAIDLQPGFAAAHAGRAAVLQSLRRHREALTSSERAIALEPRLPAAHFNRGAALRDLLRLDAAEQSFEAARSLRPENPETNCSVASLKLLRGQFDPGWALYEWRSKLPGAQGLLESNQPRWSGREDIQGKTLFIYPDQGLGDTLQFSRYALLAQQRGARVVMSVQNRLQRLLSNIGSAVTVLGEAQVAARFDYHCPLASLPRAFNTALDTIPAQVPYLAAETHRVEFWRRKLGPQGLKIGICWQTGENAAMTGRSFPLADLHPLSKIGGARLISLQHGAGSEQLQALPAGMSVEILGDEFDQGSHGFLDTAAVMQSLDLIITCDTAIAHLAGALGRPAWVLLKRLPDWRWMLGRPDSPWYPTLRLFRQNTDRHWGDVIDDVHGELIKLPAPR